MAGAGGAMGIFLIGCALLAGLVVALLTAAILALGTARTGRSRRHRGGVVFRRYLVCSSVLSAVVLSLWLLAVQPSWGEVSSALSGLSFAVVDGGFAWAISGGIAAWLCSGGLVALMSMALPIKATATGSAEPGAAPDPAGT
jgi:hypothetical protein